MRKPSNHSMLEGDMSCGGFRIRPIRDLASVALRFFWSRRRSDGKRAVNVREVLPVKNGRSVCKGGTFHIEPGVRLLST